MTCHLHILVMSEELATDVDLYTLIAGVQFSETGTELDIMKGLVCQAQHLELNLYIYIGVYGSSVAYIGSSLIGSFEYNAGANYILIHLDA